MATTFSPPPGGRESTGTPPGGDERNLRLVPQQPSPESEGFFDLTGVAAGPPLFYTAKFHVEFQAAGASRNLTVELPTTPINGPRNASPLEVSHLSLAVGGFGATKRTSRGLRHENAARGEPTASWETVRRDDRSNSERLFDPQRAHVDTIEAALEAIGRISAIGLDTDRITLNPHSMGGLAASEFAKLFPDRVDVINYIGAVSFGSPDIKSFLTETAPHIPVAFVKSLLPMLWRSGIEPTPSNIKDFWDYFFSNMPRTVGEMGSCLSGKVADSVIELGKMDPRPIRVFYQLLKDIIVVPESEVLKAHVDLRIGVPLEHHGPQENPALMASSLLFGRDLLGMRSEAA